MAVKFSTDTSYLRDYKNLAILFLVPRGTKPVNWPNESSCSVMSHLEQYRRPGPIATANTMITRHRGADDFRD